MKIELGKRICHHVQKCICGHWMTDLQSTGHTLCDECQRLYTPQGGITIMAHGAVLETVRVVYNGDVTTKTFTWSM